MLANQLAHGYIVCHQCLVGNKVVRQMRPLSDWSKHTWYEEACQTKVAPKKAKKSKKGKKVKKVKRVSGTAGKRELLENEEVESD